MWAWSSWIPSGLRYRARLFTRSGSDEISCRVPDTTAGISRAISAAIATNTATNTSPVAAPRRHPRFAR